MFSVGTQHSHHDLVNFETFPDFPGWFYCLGLRSKSGSFQYLLLMHKMFIMFALLSNRCRVKYKNTLLLSFPSFTKQYLSNRADDIVSNDIILFSDSIVFYLAIHSITQMAVGWSHEYVTTRDFTIVRHATGMIWHRYLHEFYTIGILHHTKFVEVIDFDGMDSYHRKQSKGRCSRLAVPHKYSTKSSLASHFTQ